MSKKHNDKTRYRTNASALAIQIAAQFNSVRQAAESLKIPRRAIKRFVYIDAQISAATAAKLRNFFGERVVVDTHKPFEEVIM